MKKVLLIKTSSLGDLIHTMPAITDMQQHCEGVELHWLVEEGFADVPLWHPFVKKVHCCAIRRWRKAIFSRAVRSEIKQLKQQLLAEEYDLVIDAQGLLKTAFMARWFKGAAAGYDKHSIKEPIASRFYSQQVAIEFKQPAIVRVRQLAAKLLGYCVDANTQKPSFGLHVKQPEVLPVNVDKPYMVFLHGTNWNSKLWPESYWHDLADSMTGKGMQVFIPWGDSLEQERAERIAASAADAGLIQVLPKCSLTQLAYLLQNAKAVVGMDTGLSHIAAALSAPIIGLYGSTNSALTGLQGDNVLSLQSSKSCSPCMKRECPLIKPDSDELIPCYESIAVKPVIEHLTAHLNNTQGESDTHV